MTIPAAYFSERRTAHLRAMAGVKDDEPLPWERVTPAMMTEASFFAVVDVIDKATARE